MKLRRILAPLVVAAAACAGTPSAPQAEQGNSDPLRLETIRSGLASSCDGVSETAEPESFQANIQSIKLGNETIPADWIQGLDFTGIWHLEAPGQPNFGGLSGLVEMEADGNLLAITDSAHWLLMPVDPTTRVPGEAFRLAAIRGPDGEALKGKRIGDSEGLDFDGGIALVAFEGDHRVSAFDLAGCGTEAREVVLARLTGDADGRALPNNRGPEGLALMPDGTLTIGLEARSTGDVTFGTLRTDGTLGSVERRYAPAFHLQTGIDHRDGLTARVYRAWDPFRGPRIFFTVESGNRQIASATLKPPLPVDNVEGIAIGTGLDGRTRIWLISDNNFSEDQRTLLFAFDLSD